MVLDGNQIAAVPAELLGCRESLETLDLARNALLELPVFLYTFPVLRRLDISGNSVNELNSELGGLVSLTSLAFADNLLDELPLELGLLTNLQHLAWRGNRLRLPPRDRRWRDVCTDPDVQPVGAQIRQCATSTDFSRPRAGTCCCLTTLGLCAFPHEVMRLSTLTELSLKANSLRASFHRTLVSCLI